MLNDVLVEINKLIDKFHAVNLKYLEVNLAKENMANNETTYQVCV